VVAAEETAGSSRLSRFKRKRTGSEAEIFPFRLPYFFAGFASDLRKLKELVNGLC
jgi:hypothetical protein